MPRLTISLSQERHQALREVAARTRKTLGQIIEESLDHYGIKTMAKARALVEEARRNSALDSSEAEELAVLETRARREESRR